MTPGRRSFLLSFLIWLSAGLPLRGWAKNGGDKLSLAMDKELGGRKPLNSDKISLEAPDLAEDGAIVPITVESTLADVDGVWVFVEKNPTPLAAAFILDKSLDAFVSLRIKMNESCDVIAVARSAGEYFSTRKKVRVVIGGCG